MGSVRLKINPSLASMISARAFNDWLTLDREINGDTTLGEMLTGLTGEHPDFTPVIFDPETGQVSDEINVVLNRNMLVSSKANDVKLHVGDTIILLPIYVGG